MLKQIGTLAELPALRAAENDLDPLVRRLAKEATASIEAREE
jgi:hypothetical protein